KIKRPAKLLCVETAKTNLQPAQPVGGPGNPAGRFACYKLKCPKNVPPTVAWHDQFGAGTLTPSMPKLLCAPEVVTTTTTATTTTTTTTMAGCAGALDCPYVTACNTSTGQCET